MPILRCPHCKLPLVDDEARGATCPLCNGSLKGDVPTAAKEAMPVAAPGQRSIFGLVCGGFLALLSAAMLYFAVQPWDPFAEKRQEDKKATDGTRETLPLPGSSDEAGKQPAPVQPPPKAAQNERKSETIQEPHPKPKKAVPPPPQAEIVAGEVRIIDRPNGEYDLGTLNNKAVTLSGRVKTLRVGLVDNGAILDASKLRVEEIIVTGRIDGGSTVRLNAPGGAVLLRGRVDGHSTVKINAPGGRVTFTAAPKGSTPGTIINGNSSVTVTARVVVFHGTIDGTKTRVEVTLSQGGRLQCGRLAGGSRLHYRKTDRTDPEPTVRCEGISGVAE